MTANLASPTIASIATPETDARLRAQERARGYAAAQAGEPASTCPWIGGLTRLWWLEGHALPVGMLSPVRAL